MNNSKRYILLIGFLIGLIIPQINMGQTKVDSPGKMPCQEALKNAQKVKVGMKTSEIIDLIGAPNTKSDEGWSYNFWECAKPKVGAQIVIGVSLVFKENAVAEIGWATICATGPGNSPAPKKKPKKRT